MQRVVQYFEASHHREDGGAYRVALKVYEFSRKIP
jgi:hypothetical protein